MNTPSLRLRESNATLHPNFNISRDIPLAEARRILDRLIAFPTVSRDSNLELIAWVEDYLAGHGVTARRLPEAGGRKASLHALIGPEVAGGVVLSGHSDVVPVDGQDWTTDPWAVSERDGRLFGRGTCDMKGFVALALAAVPLALKAGIRRPLQIALSCDEEIGCTGCVPMIAAMAATSPRAAAVIVGEPSRMAVVTGHKGGTGFAVHVKGVEVHSSIMHEGVNAIMEAARLIGWANRRNAAAAARAPSALAGLFDPPWTTAYVGTAQNITAGDCHFGLDYRVVPGEAAEDHVAALLAEVARVEAAMKAVRPEAGITLTRRFTVPPLLPEDRGVAEALARRLTGDNGAHVVSYGTEAGHFQAAGYLAVVCGPGDIAQAHQADEYIEFGEFAAGWRFMESLVAELCR